MTNKRTQDTPTQASSNRDVRSEIDELVLLIRATKQVYNEEFPGHDTVYTLSRNQAAQIHKDLLSIINGLKKEVSEGDFSYTKAQTAAQNQVLSDVVEAITKYIGGKDE